MEYNKIFNPITKEYINLHSPLGMKLVNSYVKHGGASHVEIDPEALLDVAADSDNINEVVRLINDGIDIDYQSDEGETALHYAIHNNNIENAIALVQHNADLNIKNEDGLTPFLLLIEKSFGEESEFSKNWTEENAFTLLDFMLEVKELDINVTNKNDESALIILTKFTIKFKNDYILDHLLSAGGIDFATGKSKKLVVKEKIDMTVTDKYGNTALDISLMEDVSNDPENLKQASELSKNLFLCGAESNSFDTNTFSDLSNENDESQQETIEEQLINHGLSIDGQINKVYKVKYLTELLSKYLIYNNEEDVGLTAVDNHGEVISQQLDYQKSRFHFGSAQIDNSYIPFSIINQLVPLDMKDRFDDEEVGLPGNTFELLEEDSANWYNLQSSLTPGDVLLDTNSGNKYSRDENIAFLVVEYQGILSLLGFIISDGNDDDDKFSEGDTLSSEGMGRHPITKNLVKLI